MSTYATAQVAAPAHRRPPPDIAPDHLAERSTALRILVTPLLALAAVLFTVVVVDDLVALVPGLGSYVSDPPARLAHGSVTLLRVMDAIGLPGDGAVPGMAVEGDRAFVEDDDGVVVVDLATGTFSHLPGVTAASRDVDARGHRYATEPSAEGATILRIDEDGRTVAIALAPFADAAAWTWTANEDGSVYAVAWTDDGDVVRARLYRLLGPDPTD